MRRALITLSILLIAASASAQPLKRRAARVAEPTPGPVSLWSALTPGPYPIGYKMWLLVAQATEFHHGPQHLVQINVWYPADATTGAPMTFRDYLYVKPAENTHDEPTDAARQAAVDEFTKPLLDAGVSAATVNAIVDSPMIARMNAGIPVNLPRSPLVFISPGNGQSAADNAVLAEFIASHGYIVVTVPSVTRLTGPLTSTDQIAARAEEQQDDDDRAASAIGDWPNAVNIPVSIIGYDIGVDAALLYAMHQPTNAIVSLDATLSPALKSVGLYDASRQLPAILDLHGDTAPDFGALTTATVISQSFPSLRHVHFTTLGFAAAASPEIARATGAGPNVRAEVAAMAARTVQFLDQIWNPIRPR